MKHKHLPLFDGPPIDTYQRTDEPRRSVANDTVSQVAKAKPKQQSQAAKILEMLQAGPVTNVQLNQVCFRYSARIFELRKKYNISKKPIGDGVFEYKLEGSK